MSIRGPAPLPMVSTKLAYSGSVACQIGMVRCSWVNKDHREDDLMDLDGFRSRAASNDRTRLSEVT
jgi:hypothetical protein